MIRGRASLESDRQLRLRGGLVKVVAHDGAGGSPDHLAGTLPARAGLNSCPKFVHIAGRSPVCDPLLCRIRQRRFHYPPDGRPVFDLLGRGAVKQHRLPFGGGNQFVTQPNGCAHAGNLWQIATGVKGETPPGKCSPPPGMVPCWEKRGRRGVPPPAAKVVAPTSTPMELADNVLLHPYMKLRFPVAYIGLRHSTYSNVQRIRKIFPGPPLRSTWHLEYGPRSPKLRPCRTATSTSAMSPISPASN